MMMREFNDDPFYSGPMETMRRMESMMDSMMSPFGMFGGHRGIDSHGQPNRSASHSNMLMPFGFGGSLFPNMDDMFANFGQMNSHPNLLQAQLSNHPNLLQGPLSNHPNLLQAQMSNHPNLLQGQMSNNPNCHSFSSSSVMTYTTDETGRPQVYQASASTRTAPGGVKETRRSVQDSRSGVQEMAIGHHLNERGHVVEKKKNRYTGDEEENHEYINLDDDDADQFNQEWQQKAQNTYSSRPVRAMLGYDGQRRTRSPPQPEMLAITDGSSPESSTGKKKSNKHKRKHGGVSHKSSNSHPRPAPYQ